MFSAAVAFSQVQLRVLGDCQKPAEVKDLMKLFRGFAVHLLALFHLNPFFIGLKF